ncbi:MAG: methylmalonyl-CoA mutase family protein, partial [Leeuwenhoekiella sp.]
MMSKSLFSEFEPVSAKAFKQKIQVDLKGDDYNDSVVWHSPEGIDIRPFYHREDFNKDVKIPGQPKHWHIAEEIYILDSKVSAKTANDAVSKGAEALFFKTEKPFKATDLLSDIEDKSVALYFNLSFLDVDFCRQILKISKEEDRNIFLNIDIIGNIARTGNWFQSLEQDFKQVSQIIENKITKNINFISIDGGLYQNAGGTIVQELAYSLAHANEYLNAFGANLVGQKLTFQMAIGGNYFFEIAKIRALRLLYATLAKEYNLPQNCH